MRCNQIASELAFHRSRVARGISRNPRTAQEREEAYLYGRFRNYARNSAASPEPAAGHDDENVRCLTADDLYLGFG